MPMLQVHLLAGRSDAAKAELVQELTETVHRVLGSDRDRVHVLLAEYAHGHWAKGGLALGVVEGPVA